MVTLYVEASRDESDSLAQQRDLVLQEARGRTAVAAACALADVSLPALTPGELSHVTRITYEEARRLWRAGATPTG